ncbi:hypothetical protein Exig_1276 [Exiguobacterium sibiricum 255-15]|uniref:Uncharacterized protein n=1 Tax=Exiguobacterium sibiricum (strain DSM 17290 / CCUG 55495 / CIP 109462 / JCM 13490 / 255-15) TaxID=262543 RepID=B1YEZ3_EXIS2|nr:hypothetical protein Exig_1276 [Exiguobacterium sibiricum 255-15]
MNMLIFILMTVITLVIISTGIFLLKFSNTKNKSTRTSGYILTSVGIVGFLVFILATLL